MEISLYLFMLKTSRQIVDTLGLNLQKTKN